MKEQERRLRQMIAGTRPLPKGLPRENLSVELLKLLLTPRESKVVHVVRRKYT